MTTTFQSCNVLVSQEKLGTLPYRYVLERQIKGKTLAHACQTKTLVDISGDLELLDEFKHTGFTQEVKGSLKSLFYDRPLHGLVSCVHTAFDKHYPLTLAPDHIWLLLCQGFADHMRLHAETLRHKFVSHEGKKDLCIIRDPDFLRNPESDWEGVMAEFSKLVQGEIGEFAVNFVAPFSTTTPIEQAIFNIALMDNFQQYFRYVMMTVCGIPSITLEGTVADWEAIYTRFQTFRDYDLAWWVERVNPILEEFIHAAQGEPNLAFWRDIYKHEATYGGGGFITGWLGYLFPYVTVQERPRSRTSQSLTPPTTEKNSDVTMYSSENIKRLSSPEELRDWYPPMLDVVQKNPIFDVPELDGRISLAVIPKGISKAPVIWKELHTGNQIDLIFSGGFMGFSQNPDSLALRPEVGWSIAESSALELIDGYATDEELQEVMTKLYSTYSTYS